MAATILQFPPIQTRTTLSRHALLVLRVKDLLYPAGGSATLKWENGFSCVYSLEWSDDLDLEGELLLEAYGRSLWRELILSRSPKRRMLTFKCYCCGRKTDSIYIEPGNTPGHDWNCGCEFSPEQITLAAKVVPYKKAGVQ